MWLLILTREASMWQAFVRSIQNINMCGWQWIVHDQLSLQPFLDLMTLVTIEPLFHYDRIYSLSLPFSGCILAATLPFRYQQNGSMQPTSMIMSKQYSQ